MVTKYLHIISVLLLVVACPYSCSHDEDWYLQSNTQQKQTLSVNVIDKGYGSSNSLLTRSSDSGYNTIFTEGDKIGVFAIKDGVILPDINNLWLTATDNNGTLVWENSNKGPKYYPDADYYAYYPYQTSLAGDVDISATDAFGFFANIIGEWQPASDQSTHEKYTAQDLMIAKGVFDNKNLSFGMKHQMALAVIKSPKFKYSFGNTSPTLTDYTTDPIFTDFDDYSPWRLSDGTYRYILKPSQASLALTGGYIDPNGKNNGWRIEANISNGVYKIYKIDGGMITISNYNLQVGDFMLKDGTLLSKGTILTDVQIANCIGLVFWVGHNENDKSDFSQTGIGEEKCHGYVVALHDAISGNKAMWGLLNDSLGLYRDKNSNIIFNYLRPDLDWNGFSYTQTIINAANKQKGLNATEPAGYPATFYAVIDYTNRVNAPKNSSGWFLPAIGQLEILYNNSSLDYATASGSDFVNYDDYWASSESSGYPSNSAMYMGFGNGKVGSYGKTFNYPFVRSVLAF